MGRSQETYSKREKEKKRLKQKKEKQERKEERKANAAGGGLDNMTAYVDEFGNITDTPPDPSKKQKVDASSIELGIPKKEKEVFDPIRNGKVEYFNHAKGFGFIRDADNQEKYFVHINGVIDEIDESDQVKFELERGAKGMNAVRVHKV